MTDVRAALDAVEKAWDEPQWAAVEQAVVRLVITELEGVKRIDDLHGRIDAWRKLEAGG